MKRILLVDDDPLFLTLMQRGLRRYAVITETDPERALALVLADPPAFVVSDFLFEAAAFDGIEFLTRVRVQCAEACRVLVSASIVAGLEACLQNGVVEYFVSKPVSPLQLERSLDLWSAARA